MLNKVHLIGRITHNLEKKFVNSNGTQIAKVDFQIAINNKDKIQFIPCVVFRNQADNMVNFLNKGSQIYVEGNISVQKYNNNNENKINTKVIVSNVIFLDNKSK